MSLFLHSGDPMAGSLFDQSSLIKSLQVESEPVQQTLTSQKQQNVAAIAEAKRNVLAGNVGASAVNNTSQYQSEAIQDLENLNPIESFLKYGEDALTLSPMVGSQITQATDANNAGRYLGEIVSDAAKDVGAGIVAGTGSIVSGAVGLVDPKSAGKFSQDMNGLVNYINDTRSETLRNTLDINNRIQQTLDEDSEAKYQRDVLEGTSPLVADLKKVGRDIINTASNTFSNSAVVGNLTASGIGSTVPAIAAATLTGGIGAIGVAGLQGGGEAFGNTYDNILQLPQEVLDNNETYQKYVQQGMSPEDARIELAAQTARLAGAAAIPVTALAGGISAPFISRVANTITGNASRNVTNRGILAGTGRFLQEPTGEAIQGASTQLVSNIATGLVDPSKRAIEGVGQAAAQEAIGGLGTSTVLGTPSALLGIGASASHRIINAASDRINGGVPLQTERVNNSNQNITQAANNINGSTPDIEVVDTVDTNTITDTDTDAVIKSKIINAASITESDLTGLSEEALKVVEDDNNRLNFAKNLQNYLRTEASTISPVEATIIKLKIRDQLNKYKQLAESTTNIQGELSDDASVAVNAAKEIQIDRQYQRLLKENIDTTPIQSITDYTPENIAILKAVSDITPSAVSDVQYDAIAGNETDPQALVLLEAKKKFSERVKNTDDVSKEILVTGNSENELPSVEHYYKNTISFLSSGNYEGATNLVNQLGQFAQHMTNKVNALNTSATEGGVDVIYDIFTPVGWVAGGGTVFHRVGNERSDEVAANIISDANAVIGAYNDIIQTVNSISEQQLTPIPSAQLINPADTTNVIGSNNQDSSGADTTPNDNTVVPTEDNTDNTSVEASQPTTEPVINDLFDDVAQEDIVDVTEPTEIAPTEEVIEEVIDTPEQVESIAEPLSDNITLFIENDNGQLGFNISDSVNPNPTVNNNTPNRDIDTDVNTQLDLFFDKNKIHLSDLIDSLIDPTPTGRMQVSEGIAFDKSKTKIFSGDILNQIKDTIKDGGLLSDILGHKYPIASRRMLYSLVNTYIPKLVDRIQNNLSDDVIEELKTNPNKALTARYRQYMFVDKDTGKYPEVLAQAMAIAITEQTLLLQESRPKTAEKIVKSLGISYDKALEHMSDLNTGIPLEMFVDSLTIKLGNLLGFTYSADTPVNVGRDLLKSLALKAVEAASDTANPIISINKILITDNTEITQDMVEAGVPLTGKKYISLNHIVPSNAIKDVSNSLSSRTRDTFSQLLVPVADSNISIVENDLVPFSKERNPQLTDIQVKALNAIQNSPWYMDNELYDLAMNKLGRDFYARTLGYKNVVKGMHVNTISSIEGKNLTIDMALNELNSLNEFIASNSGDVATIPVYYKASIMANGRISHLGTTPISDKAIRSIMYKGKSAFDNTDPNSEAQFWLAVAQNLDIKEYKANKVDPEIYQEIREHVLNKYGSIADTLNEWIDSDTEISDEARETFLKAIDALPKEGQTLQALLAVAKYRKASQAGGNNITFEYNLTAEIDGVADGIAHAITAFHAGDLTLDIIDLLASGGIYFNHSHESTNDYFRNGGQDIYYKIGSVLAENLKNLDKKTINIFTKLGLIQQTEDGITYERDIIKYPIMTFVYGISANGLTNAYLYGTVLPNLYEAITDTIIGRRTNKQLSLLDHPKMQGMTDEQFEYLFGSSSEKVMSSRDARGNPNFTLSDTEIEHLKSVISPLGNTLMDTIKMVIPKVTETISYMIDTSNVQNIVARGYYNKMLLRAFELKGFKNPTLADGSINYGLVGWLTPNEIKLITRKAMTVGAVYKLDNQTVNITSKEKRATRSAQVQSEQTSAKGGFGITLHNNVQQFGDIGVGAAPNVNIAAGDANNILNVSSNAEMGSDNKYIFDGIDIPADKAFEKEQIINSTMLETLKSNPFTGVYNSLLNTIDKVKLDDIILTEEDLSALRTIVAKQETDPSGVVYKVLRGKREFNEKEIKKILQSTLRVLRDKGKVIKNNIDRRKEVEKSLPITMNRMSGFGTGVANDIPAMSNEKFMASIDKSSEIELAINVLTLDSLYRFLDNTKLTKRQENLYKIIKDKFTIPPTVVTGTVENINLYKNKNNMPIGRNDADFKGQYDPATNTLFLVPYEDTRTHNYVFDNETVLHELIHALTIDALHLFYNNPDVLSADAQNTIQYISQIADRFMEANTGNDTPEYIALLNAMDNVSAPEAKLSEFMAWVLTNQKLSTRANTLKIPKAIKQAYNNIIRLVKSLLGLPLTQPETLLEGLTFGLEYLSSLGNNLEVDRIGWERLNQNKTDSTAATSRDFSAKLAALINERYKQAFVETNVPPNTFKQRTNNIANAQAIVRKTQLDAVGLFKDTGEKETFHAAYALMSSREAINPSALSVANVVYDKVIATLNPAMFTGNGQAKYDAILESVQTVGNRRSALPTFVALAQSSNEFRDILSTIDTGNNLPFFGNTLDQSLLNAGNLAMSEITDYLAGTRTVNNNAKKVLDDLSLTLTKLNDNSVSEVINSISSKIPNFDKITTDFVKKIKAKVLPVKLQDTNAVLNSVQSAMKKIGIVPTVVNELLAEMRGVTDKTEDVIRSMKKAKTYIEGLRQDAIETLPKLITQLFKTPPTSDELSSLTNAVFKTEAFNLLGDYKYNDLVDMIKNKSKLNQEIKSLEGVVSRYTNGSTYITEAKELADYISTGILPHNNLKQNAYAIASRAGSVRYNPSVNIKIENDIDKLISLYSLSQLNKTDSDNLKKLVNADPEAINNLMLLMKDIDATEKAKVTRGSEAYINGQKGYVPQQVTNNTRIVLAHTKDANTLFDNGFTFLKSHELIENKAYFVATFKNNEVFNQGAIRATSASYKGVRFNTGISIKGLDVVKRLANKTKGDGAIPIYDEKGKLKGYSVIGDPAIMGMQRQETDITKLMGIWKGRLLEEQFVDMFNNDLIKTISNLYNKANRYEKDNDYMDISSSSDPVINAAWDRLPRETREKLLSAFNGEGVFVHHTAVGNILGYNQASITDPFTGVTRLNPRLQKMIKDTTRLAFGDKAYKYLNNAEYYAQRTVAGAKDIIVIRSIVVPVANLISNILQAIGNNVSIPTMLKRVPEIVSELTTYDKNRNQINILTTQLTLVPKNSNEAKRLSTRVNNLKALNSKLSIWPLIDAGEYGAVAEDIDLNNVEGGTWVDAIENAIDKLPTPLRTAGKMAIISRDTALYRLLMKATQYGDFVGKVLIYEQQLQEGKSNKDALNYVTDEFVNYDYLPGRTRSYMDSTGVTMFWNYKVRSVKTAMRMLTNKPVSSLMMMFGALPVADSMINAGSPITDNIFVKGVAGDLGYSIGWDQVFNSPELIPVVNAVY